MNDLTLANQSVLQSTVDPATSIDYEDERLGTANLFFMVEPLAGWRHVEMTERRTKLDDAECMRWLVDCAHPEAE